MWKRSENLKLCSATYLTKTGVRPMFLRTYVSLYLCVPVPMCFRTNVFPTERPLSSSVSPHPCVPVPMCLRNNVSPYLCVRVSVRVWFRVRVKLGVILQCAPPLRRIELTQSRARSANVGSVCRTGGAQCCSMRLPLVRRHIDLSMWTHTKIKNGKRAILHKFIIIILPQSTRDLLPDHY